MHNVQYTSATRRSLAVLAMLTLAACRSASGPPNMGVTPPADPATIAARVALANEASLDTRTISERVIAVPSLTVRTADTSLAPLGFGLADMLITDLARSSQVTIVERARMNALLREMQMVQTGMVDSSAAPRVGKLLGARRLVVGALIDRGGGELGIETRLVNTVDGTIGGAVSARAPLASIFDAEKALVYRVFEEMGVTLTPAERAAIEQRPTANINAFLAYSRGVRDEAFGQYAAAAANFRAAVQADPNFGMARTRAENAQTSQNRIASGEVQAPVTESRAEEPKAVAAAPAPTAPTTAPSGIGAGNPTGATGTGASTLASGTINPSPVGTLGTGVGASTAQQQGSQQDRGAQAQKQPIFTTVVITIKQLP